MAGKDVSLSKTDIINISELSEAFSSAIGRKVSPDETIELCIKVLQNKVTCDGLDSIAGKIYPQNLQRRSV
jgi:hypothetical protein